MEIRRVTDRFSVSTQVAVDDFKLLREQGFRQVINNRVDGEAPDQPQGRDLAAAARAAGVAYAEIPISLGGFRMPQIEEMARALERTPGKTLAFCRTGTRSILLWALAEVQGGGDLATVASQVAAAGYSVDPIRPTLASLAARG